MIAILKREWKSYFQNITGWLFIAAVLALYGLYFLAYNLRAGYPYAVRNTMGHFKAALWPYFP